MESSARWKAEAAYMRAESLEEAWNLFGGIEDSAAKRPLAWISSRAAVWSEKEKFSALVASVFEEPAPPLNAIAVTTAAWPAWWMDMPRIYGRAGSSQLLESLDIDSGVECYRAAFGAVVAGDSLARVKLAKEALAAVPEWDSVTRARMEILLAQSKNAGAGAVHYADAYRFHSPSLIGVGLPVRVNPSVGMEDVARLLSRSGCFKAPGARAAFILDLGAAKAVLKTAEGAVLREFVYESSQQPRSTAARVVRGTFAAGPLLNERDTATLDGN
jgi:hypothetical protein